MKNCRKCHHKLEDDDSVSHMSEVNKGAQKIITDIPDQLMSVFMWTVLTGVFIFVLVVATYLMLKFETSSSDKLSILSAFHATEQPPVILNVTTREFCSTVSKELYSLEQMGYVNADRHVSRLMAMNISADDVHYVFINSTHVPWLFTCSLESALRAVKNDNSRINVFVVYGIQFERPVYDQEFPVSLSSSLADLAETYGGDRLNVRHVNLEECLECSPFKDMDLSNRPMLAKFVVQLVLLWQFGGTVLDADVVAVRGEVYRASDNVVLYDNRTFSSPLACHSFVYETMLCAKSYAMHFNGFGPETVKKIMDKTVERIKKRANARPVQDGIVCRDGVVGGRCYYVEVGPVTTADAKFYVRGFCPTVSETFTHKPAVSNRKNFYNHVDYRQV